MAELLSVEEIRSLLDSEWVLLEDPEADEGHRVLRGKLVYHSKDREAVYRKAAELRLRHSAFLYTGDIDADQVYVL
jgi:hypothetical protein